MDVPFEDHRTETAEQEIPPWFRRHPKLALLALLSLAVVIAGGIWYWLTSQNYATTSDARIAGNVTQMGLHGLRTCDEAAVHG
jgi:multidrug resistance efflux pump